MNNNKYELTILMPCLNEEKTLANCIQKAKTVMAVNKINGEILIADNGSTDRSVEISKEFGARVVIIPTKGYGAALMGGIIASNSDFIVMGDADESYDYLAIMPFVEELRKGADLVMGDRFKGGIKPGAMPFSHKYIGNPVLSFLGRLLFRTDVRDFHSGLRGFRKESILNLSLQTTGMEFASEMVVKSVIHGYKIAEVPIILYPDGRDRPPHLRTWRDGWRHLRFLMLYAPNWIFLYPGLLELIIGMVISVILLTGPKTIGTITFDIDTLLYASIAILIGLQSITFSLFTKVYAMNEGLIPGDPLIHKAKEHVNLEKGLAVGVCIFVLGLAGSIFALSYWKSREFGVLNPSISMRIAIPGAVLMTSGIMVTLSSFFMSILTLNHKK
jgi:glycosyltransferase involved in cell wall biosynthesis